MIIAINRLFRRLRKDEKGATAIEYGLIAALISVAIIAGASAIGGSLNKTFSNISDCLDNANASNGAGTSSCNLTADVPAAKGG